MTREGGRGGGWVVAQFVLMALVIPAALVGPEWPGDGTRWGLLAAGILIALLGARQAGSAFRTFGRALTPFPVPAADARLLDTGPFAQVRHPVYGGVLGIFVGIGLATRPAALGVAFALALLWLGKARVEERILSARFPGYAAYRARVRRRFVPGVW